MSGLLIVDRATLLVIGKVLPATSSTVTQYVAKLDEAKAKGSRVWARLPVMRREELGDFHSALIGLGFLVAVGVNLVGVGASAWLDGVVRWAALAPVVAVGAAAWTSLSFHAVLGQARLAAHRDDWDFTITKAPLLSLVLFAAFVALEVLLLG